MNVQVYVCHPGAPRTELIRDNASFMTNLLVKVFSPFLFQSAELGSWPEVMCATEEDVLLLPFENKYYGPTGRGNWTGPVGECTLESHALDKDAAKQLWELSEKETGLKWTP